MPPVIPMCWTAVQYSQQYNVHFQQPKRDGYNRDHLSSSQSPARSPAAFIMHQIRITATIPSIHNLPQSIDGQKTSVTFLFTNPGAYPERGVLHEASDENILQTNGSQMATGDYFRDLGVLIHQGTHFCGLQIIPW